MSVTKKILDELIKKCPNVHKLYFDNDNADGFKEFKDIKYYYEDYIYNTYVDKMYFLHRISFEESNLKNLK